MCRKYFRNFDMKLDLKECHYKLDIKFAQLLILNNMVNFLKECLIDFSFFEKLQKEMKKVLMLFFSKLMLLLLLLLLLLLFELKLFKFNEFKFKFFLLDEYVKFEYIFFIN